MNHVLCLALTSLVGGCRLSPLQHGSRRPEQDIWPHLCCGFPPGSPLLDCVLGRTFRQKILQLLSASHCGNLLHASQAARLLLLLAPANLSFTCQSKFSDCLGHYAGVEDKCNSNGGCGVVRLDWWIVSTASGVICSGMDLPGCLLHALALRDPALLLVCYLMHACRLGCSAGGQPSLNSLQSH